LRYIFLNIGFRESTDKINVIQSVVNDRSLLTLKTVIAEIRNKQIDSTDLISVTVKTVCERYLVETAVSSGQINKL